MNENNKIIKVWLVRHGESEVNKMDGSRFTGSNLWSELTERGRRQAIRLGEQWKGINFTQWYCSPAVRTQQTARYCMQGISNNIQFPQSDQEDKIRPIYKLAPAFVEQNQGEAEGRLKVNFDYRIADGHVKGSRVLSAHDNDEDWWIARPYSKITNQFVPRSESQKQVYERAITFLQNEIDCLSPKWQSNMRIVIFTHEVVIKCLCSKLFANTLPFKGMFINNTAVVKLQYSSRWILEGLEGEAKI